MASLTYVGLYSPADIACAVCRGRVSTGTGFVKVTNAAHPFQLLGRVCSPECARKLDAAADALLDLPEAQAYPYGGREGLAVQQ